jgi:ribonuclease HII
VQLARVAIAELKARYAAGALDATSDVLRSLRGDRREGARALAETLAGRARRETAERNRLSGLFALERELASLGHTRIAGVDEVGMGPLAGPVVAAAVILPPDAWLPGLNDSKRLSRIARERIAREIEHVAVDIALGSVEPDEIDRVNIYQAGLLAMRRAVEALAAPPDALVVDARRVPGVICRQESLVGGDSRVAAIAAASIVAKVWRDARMAELDRHHPGYGFARHAGYGTPEHLAALAALGPSAIHRRSFEPVRACAARFGDACRTS